MRNNRTSTKTCLGITKGVVVMLQETSASNDERSVTNGGNLGGGVALKEGWPVCLFTYS